MARFTALTFNTGAVASGATYDHDVDIAADSMNIGKIKIVPSGSTIGYSFQIHKKAVRTDAWMQYATRDRVIGNFYDPTDRSGLEVLQAFVLPYEDLDSTTKIHTRIINFDSVARSYDITIEVENPAGSID